MWLYLDNMHTIKINDGFNYNAQGNKYTYTYCAYGEQVVSCQKVGVVVML